MKRNEKVLLVLGGVVVVLALIPQTRQAAVDAVGKVVSMIKNIGRTATAKAVVAKWKPLAESWANAWGCVPTEVLAIICQESGGNPQALNPRDPSRGLMAVTPGALSDFNKANHKAYSFDQLYDPEINVEVGSWYFASRSASSLSHNLNELFEAYNAGLGNLPAGADYAQSVQDYLVHVEAVYYS